MRYSILWTRKEGMDVDELERMEWTKKEGSEYIWTRKECLDEFEL